MEETKEVVVTETPEAIQQSTDEKPQTVELEVTPEANEKPESENVAEQDEQKEEAESGNDAKLKELEEKLNEALKMGEKAITLAKTVEDLTGEIESKQAVIGEYESLLKTVIDGKMQNVPEQYHELIPANMGLKEKLEWLEKAESKGLFNKQEKENPAIEIGKPMNVEVPKVDTSKMSASSLLSLAYNTLKN